MNHHPRFRIDARGTMATRFIARLTDGNRIACLGKHARKCGPGYPGTNHQNGHSAPP